MNLQWSEPLEDIISAEIFSQGDEVTTGIVANTNAAWLSEALTDLGIRISRHSAIGDHLDHQIDLLREISGRADLCICTGGLGPTTDDLTTEAVAKAFNRRLKFDPEAAAQIEDWYKKHGRVMPEVNSKQALLPEGSWRLDNLWGTAPGFMLDQGSCCFFFLPGVPTEMKEMYQKWVKPAIEQRFRPQRQKRIVLGTVGIGESNLQEKINELKLSPTIRVGYQAMGPENKIKLFFPEHQTTAEINAIVASVGNKLGDAVYAISDHDGSDISLDAVVGKALTAGNYQLYCVETLSGGQLAQRCSDSANFAGAIISNNPEQLAKQHGMAFNQDLTHMAANLARKLQSENNVDLSLVQLAERVAIANPDSREPVELHLALACHGSLYSEKRIIHGNLKRKRLGATAHSLDFIRRCLLQFENNL